MNSAHLTHEEESTLAEAHYKAGDLAKAVRCYLNAGRKSAEIDTRVHYLNKALKIQPNNPTVLTALGGMYLEKKDYQQAEFFLHAAVDNDPNFAPAFCNFGVLAYRSDRYQEANDYYQRAIQLAPDNSSFYTSQGTNFLAMGDIKQAKSAYEKAVALNPNNARAHYNLGLLLLKMGNYTQGWQEYEWRSEYMALYDKRVFPDQFKWNGQPLEGKKIMLFAEQGIGDTLQFVRYARFLKSLGPQLYLECQNELISLMQDTGWFEDVFPRISPVTRSPQTVEGLNYHSSLISLPRLFKTNSDKDIPAYIPYLKFCKERSAKFAELSGNARLKCGFVWSGNPNHPLDHIRSCPLDAISPLFKLNDATFFSLQVGEKNHELLPYMKMYSNIVDLSAQLNNFSDTASAIMALDVIVTVDTSVAHLAGALGKQTCLLLAKRSDWRWGINKPKSPWYPTIELFRQQILNDWSSPVEEIKRHLSLKTL